VRFLASSHFDSLYFCGSKTEETQVKGPSLPVKRGLKGKHTDTRSFRINIKKKSLGLKFSEKKTSYLSILPSLSNLKFNYSVDEV
jgi:hypothetical protein